MPPRVAPWLLLVALFVGSTAHAAPDRGRPAGYPKGLAWISGGEPTEVAKQALPSAIVDRATTSGYRYKIEPEALRSQLTGEAQKQGWKLEWQGEQDLAVPAGKVRVAVLRRERRRVIANFAPTPEGTALALIDVRNVTTLEEDMARLCRRFKTARAQHPGEADLQRAAALEGFDAPDNPQITVIVGAMGAADPPEREHLVRAFMSDEGMKGDVCRPLLEHFKDAMKPPSSVKQHP